MRYRNSETQAWLNDLADAYWHRGRYTMPELLPFVPRNAVVVVRTDGSVSTHRFDKRPDPGEYAKLINADMLDFVMVGRANGTDLVMAVDDHSWNWECVDVDTGKVISRGEEVAALMGNVPRHFQHRATTPRKPINRKATDWYLAICIPGTTHQIAGDVVLLHDKD